MMILLKDDRFRTTTDEWWVMANWNENVVLTFEDHFHLNKYVAKHALKMYRIVTVESLAHPPSLDQKRLKKVMQIEYDCSNKQCYAFVPLLHFYDTSADDPRYKRLDVQMFTSLGLAQAFYIHMAAQGAGWKVENENQADQCWSLDLTQDNPHGAYQVTIHELLLTDK